MACTCKNCNNRLRGKWQGKCRITGLEVKDINESCILWEEGGPYGERIQIESDDDHGTAEQG